MGWTKQQQGVPRWQIYEEPVFSTCKPVWKMLNTVLVYPIAGYLLYCVLKGKKPDPFDGQILIAAVCMAFYFTYRRRNHKSMMESGLYFVRRCYAVFIPWEKVKSAYVDIDSHIQLELDREITDQVTDTPIVFDNLREAGRFPMNDDAIRCLMRHVPVTGSETWEKEDKKRFQEPWM